MSNKYNFRKELKKSPICYVCGKRIPLYGGRLVHKGPCQKIYHIAYQRYQNEKRKAKVTIDK